MNKNCYIHHIVLHPHPCGKIALGETKSPPPEYAPVFANIWVE